MINAIFNNYIVVSTFHVQLEGISCDVLKNPVRLMHFYFMMSLLSLRKVKQLGLGLLLLRCSDVSFDSETWDLSSQTTMHSQLFYKPQL